MDRYIVVSNSIIDREKITWVDLDIPVVGSVTVHFVSGDKDDWDGENAKIIWHSFFPPENWREFDKDAGWQRE